MSPSLVETPEQRPSPVALDLLVWYDEHRRRHLPWREEPSPYRTLVSEFMLQQTRVETALPFFERFVARFPDFASLAAAPLDDVLSLWAGLGYYSRARNLHASAKAVVAAGAFPDTVEGLRALPGVGPYMAGAIGSIALGQDVPTVDGNIARVLSRLHAFGGSRAKIWPLAARHVPPGRAGDHNQALMDLGSSICVPRKPACMICPLRTHCVAHAEGRPEAFPVLPPKRRAPRRRALAAVWRRGDTILLVRRPAEGLFGGLYDLPWTFDDAGTGPVALQRWLEEELGASFEVGAQLGTVRHTLTHMRLELQLHAVAGEGEPQPRSFTAARWTQPTHPGELGLSTLARKALRMVITHR